MQEPIRLDQASTARFGANYAIPGHIKPVLVCLRLFSVLCAMLELTKLVTVLHLPSAACCATQELSRPALESQSLWIVACVMQACIRQVPESQHPYNVISVIRARIRLARVLTCRFRANVVILVLIRPGQAQRRQCIVLPVQQERTKQALVCRVPFGALCVIQERIKLAPVYLLRLSAPYATQVLIRLAPEFRTLCYVYYVILEPIKQDQASQLLCSVLSVMQENT